MTDIRKRINNKGEASYQVRYAVKGSATGYAYKSFATLKEARHYVDAALPRHRGARHATLRSVEQAVDRWLDVCEHEGREGKDPVSKATLRVYRARADAIKRYDWSSELHELGAPDVVAFRSWLLRTFTRDQAKKILSSFHSVLLEMKTQGVLVTDPGAGITIQESRYKEAVRIPSVAELQAILAAADDLAEHGNGSIAKAWKRYRPMVYLAADSGLRPQELLVLRGRDLLDKGVHVAQALDRSSRIGPPKSKAGRRFIPVGRQTVAMVREFMKDHEGPNPHDLCFPGTGGGVQSYNNFLRRCWHVLMEEAGLVAPGVDGQPEPVYSPYSLRHFYASMLIAQNKDIKTIQERMGHRDAALTLNVYGHLIRLKQAEDDEADGVLSAVIAA